MNVALWIVAGVLAAGLLVSSAKLVIPKDKIVAAGDYAAWAQEFNPSASNPSPDSAVMPSDHRRRFAVACGFQQHRPVLFRR
ncbi:hypothetical protein FEK35_10020 [Nocardia cyriacigeorgica]|uniref:Uncharacterized protein n=1 Tax=Nocardia cyriacigeorgica TaxID=135487 RepID=A0A5R8PHQ5_9NOCA|nr:hypothetical protein [Nocardia cyriacigeorgica]TLG13475.1 hypothetical protein FEK35_10020 [Nocardia cyriacigeorgica]